MSSRSSIIRRSRVGALVSCYDPLAAIGHASPTKGSVLVAPNNSVSGMLCNVYGRQDGKLHAIE